MQQYLYLDRFMTPKLVTYLYWLLLFSVFIKGLEVLFTTGIIQGVLFLIIGAFASRIICELVLVIFKINEAFDAQRAPKSVLDDEQEVDM